jgi:colanic acid biosynthesis glycosyl transferase WcaI
MRNDGVKLAFSVRGNRVPELQQAVLQEDTNICFLPFAPPEQLEARLRSADIHVVSLQETWTGTVVPSKFFGALAIGRPVLFFGSEQSAVAKWINEFRVGWVLSPENAEETAAKLRSFLRNSTAAKTMRDRCHRVYQEHFSKWSVQNQWHRLLSTLVTDQLISPPKDRVEAFDSDHVVAG